MSGQLELSRGDLLARLSSRNAVGGRHHARPGDGEGRAGEREAGAQMIEAQYWWDEACGSGSRRARPTTRVSAGDQFLNGSGLRGGRG